MSTNSFILILLSLTFSQSLLSQSNLVTKGISNASIILNTQDQNTMIAATIFQRFMKESSGVTIPILGSLKDTKGSNIYLHNALENREMGISEDGFMIHSEKGKITIHATGDKGIIYGITYLLEQYCQMKYFAPFQYTLPKKSTIHIPKFNVTENPSFAYRQTQFYGIETDSIYKYWHRLETPKEIFVSNYWVHTFEKILPSDIYGKTNPEFFSYFNGKRHPGKASQWCLTNDDLFEEVCRKLDKLFSEDPEKKVISVSQNDSNFTNCSCDKCQAIDKEQGSPSGSLIYFMNRLAKKYPEKTISTLAYLYSMTPPASIRPLPNVNIMLCSIDAMREAPLTKTPSGKTFEKALKGWSAISDNIFVWDYGINFDNYLSPFPNFHVLQDNMQLFHNHKTTMHFSQIGGPMGCNFAELRAYMVSKLMWNVNADTDDVMKEFLDGYYGAASKYIYEYIKIMEGALLASEKRLWIYDSPVTHKNGMLNTHLLEKYEKLFDSAESAVESDSVLLARVQITRLPILYSYLEIKRTENTIKPAEVNKRLTYFENLIRKYKILTLNERNNSPLEYCEMYKSRYLDREQNLATGKKVTYLTEPTGRYAELGKTALTDGMYGGTTFADSWVGWEGSDGSFILDLGESTTFESVTVDFLHQLGSWILLPKSVTFSYSSDGITFEKSDKVNLDEDKDAKVKFVSVTNNHRSRHQARYIKVEVEGTKICPPWHYGVGRNCWFFMDEVVVR